MGQKTIHRVAGEAQTAGAVAVTVASALVPTGCGVRAVAHCVGREIATGATHVSGRVAAAKDVAGALSAVGAVADLVAPIADAALATAAVTIDISGNTVRLRATGVLATNIEWFGELTLYIN